LWVSLTLFSGSLAAQETPAAAQQTTPAPQSSAQSAPQSAPQSTTKKPIEPDYPDPRSLSVELFYWQTVPGKGPDVLGGKLATGYSSLYELGKAKPAPGIDVRLPITRTGELRFEGFLEKGTGNQIAPLDTTLYGTSYAKGDYLSTQYQITTGKIYLDDLLYPYKFPVSKFRLKSLWALRYLKANTTIDAPLSTSTTGTTATASRQVFLPEFGIAAEYAIARHVLLRVDGSGFGLPGKSVIWDGNATISYRHGQFTIEGGYKALGFRTTPNKDEYVRDILQGGFVGIRYNWK
jgi:hypothetical protein